MTDASQAEQIARAQLLLSQIHTKTMDSTPAQLRRLESALSEIAANPTKHAREMTEQERERAKAAFLKAARR